MKEKMMTKEADLDERFQFGPTPIQTAEDAVMAFLRKEITEEEFRTACDKYGVIPGTLFNPHSARVERIDSAYEQTLPEDLFPTADPPQAELKDRIKVVEDKEKARQQALKDNPPVRPEVAAATPVHEVGGTAADIERHEVKEDQKLPPAQTASTKK
jgi:hypothetical protein